MRLQGSNESGLQQILEREANPQSIFKGLNVKPMPGLLPWVYFLWMCYFYCCFSQLRAGLANTIPWNREYRYFWITFALVMNAIRASGVCTEFKKNLMLEWMISLMTTDYLL